MKKILVVAAHPDDEILGCGGTVARLIKEGAEAYTLILGEGITSRDEKKGKKSGICEINSLKKYTFRANAVLGIKDIFTHSFPDNRFDIVSLLNIVKVVEKVKNKIRPDIVFTHYKNDLNKDHRITCQAVITALRPFAAETVKEIYSFETLSSTEWNYATAFFPNVFFDVTKTIGLKLKAMAEYKSEIKKSSHPRSIESAHINAKLWGIKVGLKYAEAFECIRCIR